MVVRGLNGQTYEIELVSDLEPIKKEILVVNYGDHKYLLYNGANTDIIFNVNSEQVVTELENGFVWDGASIPVRCRKLIGHPTDREFIIPSMIHDIHYGTRSDRATGDALFYYLLKLNNVPEWKIALMYVAVRTGEFAFYAADTSKFWLFVKKLFKSN